jgi:hypothetical protein
MMIRVKAVLKVDFAEALRPWLDLRELIRAGEASEKPELQGPPIVVSRVEQKQRIVLQVRAVSVEQEADPGAEPDTKRMIDSFRRLGAVLPMPPVASARVEYLALDPYDLPFHELVARVKETLLCVNSLAATATDVSVVTDEQVDEETIRHVQVGPMLPAQLNQQFLVFRREDVPAQFLYVSAARTVTHRTDFSVEALEAQVAECDGWAAATAAEVSAIVRA